VLIVNSVLGFIAKSPQEGLVAVAVNVKVSCLETYFTISFSTYPIQILTVKAVPAVAGVFATNLIVDYVLGSYPNPSNSTDAKSVADTAVAEVRVHVPEAPNSEANLHCMSDELTPKSV